MLLASALLVPGCALAWSNGGYSANIADPDYGTHDWLAEKALDLLPETEKQYLVKNNVSYVYGTELPDKPKSQGGYGDTTNHHIYYNDDKTPQDNASAKRAEEEYQKAMGALRAKDYANASMFAGSMAHYICDVAVFSHVMGKYTEWGEETHHSDYEDWVNSKTDSNDSSYFVITPDGALNNISAYQAALDIAYDTTFGVGGDKGCKWMDEDVDHEDPTRAYDTGSQAFIDRVSQSLNLAVNKLADVLHTLALEANYTGSITTSPPPEPDDNTIDRNTIIIGAVVAVAIVLLIMFLLRKKGKKRRRRKK